MNAQSSWSKSILHFIGALQYQRQSFQRPIISIIYHFVVGIHCVCLSNCQFSSHGLDKSLTNQPNKHSKSDFRLRIWVESIEGMYRKRCMRFVFFFASYKCLTVDLRFKNYSEYVWLVWILKCVDHMTEMSQRFDENCEEKISNGRWTYRIGEE